MIWLRICLENKKMRGERFQSPYASFPSSSTPMSVVTKNFPSPALVNPTTYELVNGLVKGQNGRSFGKPNFNWIKKAPSGRHFSIALIIKVLKTINLDTVNFKYPACCDCVYI